MINVADLHTLSILTKQGIDINHIELKSDYASRNGMKERSPYARFFANPLNPNQRIMQLGILPRVTNAGFFVVPQFRQVDAKFVAEENCFEAEIKDKQITVTCINDQPNGRKKFDQAIWRPQVYLDGVEQTCGNPLWLETDHMNPNYHFNVLEYNYGFCKRRIRIIEGRFRDRITLTSNPNAEFKVVNNATGNMRLKFGSKDGEGMPVGIVKGDVEIISKEELAKAIYPITIGASPETFYPDADAETSSVDGSVRGGSATAMTWAELTGHVGDYADDSTADFYACYFRADQPEPKWDYMYRGVFLYDTSGLPDTCTITAAVLSIYGTLKADDASNTPDICVYSSAPASNTALASGDFDSLGNTELSSTITYAAYSTTGYNDFTLNATGRAAISKTSISKFGTRNANYDVADELDPGNHIPTWGADGHTNRMMCYMAEQGDTTSDPKLVVTYTVGVIPRHGFVNFQDPGIV